MSGHFMFFAAIQVTLRFVLLSLIPLMGLVYFVTLARGDLNWTGMANATDQAIMSVGRGMVPLIMVVYVSALAYLYVTV